MLSGILLILVTMLAVLGAYYLTELASQASAKRKTLKNAVVLLCAQDAEQMWAAVLDARAKLPDAALVVRSPKAAGAPRCAAFWRCRAPGDGRKSEKAKEGACMEETLSISGTVETVVYANEQTGYAVLEVADERDGELYTAVGPLCEVRAGEEVTLHGRFAMHPTFGQQFKTEG